MGRARDALRAVLVPAPIAGARGSRASRPVLAPSTWSPGGGVGLGRQLHGARLSTGEGLAPFTFPEWPGVWSRDAAMSIPTISRARDLICSLVGSLPLTLWREAFPIEDSEQLPPLSWLRRPDPARTRNWLLAWTTDDLLFEARAYWRVVDRYADGFPSAFERMPAAEVAIDGEGRCTWGGVEVEGRDVIQFLSPTDGLLYAGARAMSIALELDLSAERYARLQTPAGWLQEQPGGEPSDGTYLAAQASAFAQARESNTIAALNALFQYHESSMDPGKLQLTEGRSFQALELARVANVPPYLVGAPAGSGMTYQNAQQARSDLVDFGAMPYVNAIEQTLSGPNVCPLTQVVRLDVEAWLRTAPGEAAATEPEPAPAEQEAPE